MSTTAEVHDYSIVKPKKRWRSIGAILFFGFVGACLLTFFIEYATTFLSHKYLGLGNSSGMGLTVRPPPGFDDEDVKKAAASMPPVNDKPQVNPQPAPQVHKLADVPEEDYRPVSNTASNGHSEPRRLTPTEVDAAAFGGAAKPLNLPGTVATVAKDLSRTLRPGTRIPCILQNAIDTATGEGDYTCLIGMGEGSGYPGVLSWDNKVVLMPVGTQIFGHYKPLQTGRNRIALASAFATGDDGLVVPLGDPVTDAEGRMGVTGEIQDNTWSRIKEGVLLDLVGTGLNMLPYLAQRGNGNTYFNVQTNGTDQAVAETIRRNGDIPDVLKKNAGEMISIITEHPAYFSEAIKLVMRNGYR